MKRLIIFLLLFAAIKVAGQTTGYLRFDTVRIMKQNGTCELYIINKTKDTLGLLTNVGGGLTQFMKSRVLNDSTIVVGLDTLVIVGGSGGGGGSGSVTSISQGYGITNTPNPITSTGTIDVDTLNITTIASRDKLKDSLQANINLKVNISDTSTMLANYIRDANDGLQKTGQVASIATNGVTDAKIRQSAALSVIGRSANSTGNVTDITAGSDHAVFRRSGTTLGFGAINLASTNAVTGLLPNANLSFTGTPDGTKFLRDDFSWQTVSGGGGTPGGSNTHVQFNNSSAFGGDAGFTWNNTNKELQIMSTGETVNGAVLDFYLNKGTPVVNDRIYEAHAYLKNLSGTKVQMVADYTEAVNVTAGSESGRRLMNVTINGAGNLREFFNAGPNNGNNGVLLRLANNFYMDEITGKFSVNNINPSGYFHIQNSINGQQAHTFTNTNTGTSAFTDVQIASGTSISDGNNIRILKTGDNYSATGMFKQDAGIVEAGTAAAGGLSVGATHASGVIRWYTGGQVDANERGSITAAGNFIIKALDTDGTAPTTSGTTKMVITDDIGQLSFADIPGGGAGITGSGTANFGAKFTGASTIGNSLYQDNGTNTAINMAPSTDGRFQVLGATGTTNTSAIARFLAAAGEGIYLGYNTASDYGFIGAARDGVAHDNLALAQSGGNVTIGATAFSEKLRVHGTMRVGGSTEASTTSTPNMYVAVDGLATVAIRNATSDIEGYHLVGTSGSETGYVFGSVTNHPMYFRTNNLTRASILSTGEFGIGVTSPTARLHLAAGTATANTAPFKFTSGTNLTTAEAGAMEFDGTNFYLSPSTTRKRITLTNNATPSNGQIPIGNGTDYTVANITGSNGISITNGSGTIDVSGAGLGPVETTTTASTTSGGAAQNVDITLNTNLHGEIEVYVVGIGGTTAGSYHYRTFVYFAGNGSTNAPTINSTTLQGGPLTLEGIGGSPSATVSAISSPVQGVRIALNASSTEDVAWKVHYKIRSHTFPL